MAPERVVLVTGGSRGIGRGIAEGFLEDGARVAICSRNPTDAPAGLRHYECDVRDAEQVERLFDRLVADFGRVDVVVNNAGGSPYCDAADASPRFIEKIVSLNLLAPFFVCREAHRVMERGGVIINIASVSGTRPSPGTAAYGAAKAGLINLTQTLAVEWAARRIRVNAIVAGLVATEHSEDHYGGARGLERVAKTVPAQRMGTPKDVADLCRFLASERADYLTGAAIPLHGGGEWPAFLRP